MRTWASLALLLAASPAWGAAWSAQSSGTVNTLRAVHFPVDELTGYVCGDEGTLLKTTDGGATWVPKDSGASTMQLRSVWFPVDASTGHISANGRYHSTIDGGESWSVQILNYDTTNLSDVFFLDASNGWMVANPPGSDPNIFWSFDAGATWTTALDAGPVVGYESVWFVSATTGFAVGEQGTIVKSSDGGVTWAGYVPKPTTGILYGVHFPTATTGYAVGTGGTILKTINTGGTWTVQTSGTVDDLNALCFLSADRGYVVGDSGRILRTTDGGITWMPQDAGTSSSLKGAWFPVNGSNGWAVGADGTILKTTDSSGSQVVLHPNGNGTVNGFTTACDFDHWRCVNDQPSDAAIGTWLPHDGSGSFLEGESAGAEMFALADGVVPAGSTVTGIEIQARVGKQGGGAARSARLNYDVGWGALTGQAFQVTGGPQCTQLATQSWTGLTLTPSDIDALEIGIEHVSGGPIRVTQLYVVITYDGPIAPKKPRMVRWRELRPS